VPRTHRPERVPKHLRHALRPAAQQLLAELVRGSHVNRQTAGRRMRRPMAFGRAMAVAMASNCVMDHALDDGLCEELSNLAETAGPTVLLGLRGSRLGPTMAAALVMAGLAPAPRLGPGSIAIAMVR